MLTKISAMISFMMLSTSAMALVSNCPSADRISYQPIPLSANATYSYTDPNQVSYFLYGADMGPPTNLIATKIVAEAGHRDLVGCIYDFSGQSASLTAGDETSQKLYNAQFISEPKKETCYAGGQCNFQFSFKPN